MRKAFSAVLTFTVILSLSLMSLLVGCGAEKESKVVRIGYLRNDLHQLAYYVAREKGYFTGEGLDVREGGAFNAGPEEMSAFSAGQLDMGYVGAAPCVTFAAQKMADVKIVAQANQVGSAVVVRRGLECDDVAGLKGRTVAVPGYSTVQDFLLRLALDDVGLKGTDVNIITLKPPEMIAALTGGQVDAFVAWEPYTSQAIEQNAGRVLVNSSEIWSEHPCCVLIVDEEFLKREPETVRAAVAAHVKATDYINKNPLEASDMAHLFTGQETKVVKRAMENIEFTYELDVEGLERYADFLKETGVVKVKDVGSFIRGLLKPEFLPGGSS